MSENRRKLFRVDLSYRAVAGVMAVEVINGAVYPNRRKVDVLVADISAGGARVFSPVWFPTNKNALIRFRTKIDDFQFDFQACALWQNKRANDMFEYGIEFIDVDDQTMEEIVQVLNRLVISMKKVGAPLGNTNFTNKPELVRLFEVMKKCHDREDALPQHAKTS